jgi:hypothetical protein
MGRVRPIGVRDIPLATPVITAAAYAPAAPPAPLARRPTPLSSAVLAYGGTAAANGSGLAPALSRLRGTYALTRSGGGSGGEAPPDRCGRGWCGR